MADNLDYSQTRSLNVGVSIDTSIEAAMIYDDLVYAQKVFGNGYFFRSDEQMLKRFPMFSKSTLRRHVAKLVEVGYISTKVKKVNGKPVLNYQIEHSLLVKMTKTKEIVKMTNSINIETKEETKNDFFLEELISLVNKKEKATAERLRMLNARLKDYSQEDILGAAKAFSRSQWHRENGQMSIDNLLAPSKFGRWFAKSNDGSAPTITASNDQWGYKNGQKIFTEDEKGNKYWGGELITPENQDQVLKERMAE